MPELADTQTGEVHYVGIIKRPRHTKPFTLVFQDALLELLKGPARQLSGLELKVLLHLVAVADYGNTIDRYNWEMARDLGAGPASISRALTSLASVGLIRRETTSGGRPNRIHLSPEVAFRGNVKQRASALDRYGAPRPQRATE